jgi:hypothetical protein
MGSSRGCSESPHTVLADDHLRHPHSASVAHLRAVRCSPSRWLLRVLSACSVLAHKRGCGDGASRASYWSNVHLGDDFDPYTHLRFDL